MGNKNSSTQAHDKDHGASSKAPSAPQTVRTQRVLVVGNGSREHAIVWKLLQSPTVSHIFLAPANAALDTLLDHTGVIGLDEKSIPVIKNTPFASVGSSDILSLVDYCCSKEIDLVVIGPELPLAHGIADCLASKNIKCFGPKQVAAELESSKAFSKCFMTDNQIPTARYRVFRDGEYMEALQYVNECESSQHHVVVKASGLCGGKGVYVCSSHEDARTALRILFLEQPYGDQSLPVIIEERLVGREVSVMAFCDGSSYSLMPCAHDYKRRYSGDLGPNTGGMGCVAPLPKSYVTEQDLEQIRSNVFDKTVDGLSRQKRMFVGVIYAGIMLTSEGPMVLEYNCRFGDPEAEVVLPLLVTDLYDIMKFRSSRCFLRQAGVACCVAVAPSPLRAFADASADAWCIELRRDAVEGEANNDLSKNEADFRTDIGYDVLFDFLEHGEDEKAVENQTSYAAAGVNIEKGNAVVANIADICRRSRVAGVNSDAFGSFGALFDWNEYVADCTSTSKSPELVDNSNKDRSNSKLRQPQQISRKKSGKAANVTSAAGGGDAEQAQHPQYLSQPVFVSGCDGVGSKLLLAQRLGKLGQVGIDLVAMCVNDVLCHGAAPLYFLDYYACGKLNSDEMVQVVEGIGAGCQLAGCALVGGETAELPGMYTGKKFDLAGFTVGVVDARSLLPKLAAIQAGDLIIGLASSGIHSNGFSLVRKILSGTTTAEDAGIDDVDVAENNDAEKQQEQSRTDAVYQRLIRPASFDIVGNEQKTANDAGNHKNRVEIGAGDASTTTAAESIQNAANVSLGDVLLAPTKIYTRSILPLLRSAEHGTHIKALAHITGGGLVDNIPRVLPPNLTAQIDAQCWPIPPVFGWIAKQGSVKSFDMARTFNLGIGMAMVVDQNVNLEQIQSFLSMCGETAYVIGHVIEKEAERPAFTRIKNLDRALLNCIARGSKGDALQTIMMDKYLSVGKKRRLSSQNLAGVAENGGPRGILRKTSGDSGVLKVANGVHFAQVVAKDAESDAERVDDAVETIVLQRTGNVVTSTTTTVVVPADNNVASDSAVELAADAIVDVEQMTTTTLTTTTGDVVQPEAEQPTAESTVGDIMKSLAAPPADLEMMTGFVNRLSESSSEESDEQLDAKQPARVAVLISGTGSNLQSLLDYSQRLEYDKPAIWWRRDRGGAAASRKTSTTSNLSVKMDAGIMNGLEKTQKLNGNLQNEGFNDVAREHLPFSPCWRPWQVKLVISNKKNAGGLVRARQHSLATINTVVVEHSKYPTREKFDEALSCELRRERIDVVVLAGFMRILSPQFCEEWCGRLINIHPSLLPAFRGAGAQDQAHKARVRVAGCTVHFVEPNVDAGPIIVQACVPAYPGRDTVEDLRLRILEREHYILPRALDLLVSGFVRYAVPSSNAENKQRYLQNMYNFDKKHGRHAAENGETSGGTLKARSSYRHSMANWGGTLTRKMSTLPAVVRKHSSGSGSGHDASKISEEAAEKANKLQSGKKSGEARKRYDSKEDSPPTSSAVCEWHPSALRVNFDNMSSR